MIKTIDEAFFRKNLFLGLCLDRTRGRYMESRKSNALLLNLRLRKFRLATDIKEKVIAKYHVFYNCCYCNKPVHDKDNLIELETTKRIYPRHKKC